MTVLRDGELVGTKDTDKLSKDEMISMMVGRVVYEKPKLKSTVPKVSQSSWKSKPSCRPTCQDVNFHVRKGEILGFAGFDGCRAD